MRLDCAAVVAENGAGEPVLGFFAEMGESGVDPCPARFLLYGLHFRRENHITAPQELVVPKSMPMIFPMFLPL